MSSKKHIIYLSEMLLFVHILFFSHMVQGNVLTVGNGASYENIYSAVQQANDGDTIQLYDGVFSGSSNTNIELGEKSLIITGTNPQSTAIDCMHQGFAFHSAGHSVSLMISNLNFTNCNGALQLMTNMSSIQISGVTFFNNSRTSGAAIYLYGVNTVQISDSVFQNNTATDGGAIYVLTSNVTIESSVFYYNKGDTSGGAIYSERSTVHVSDSLFLGNRATVGGAWIFSSSRDVQITNTQFIKNYAVTDGASILAQSSTCHITSCYFAQNRAQTGGAVSAALSNVFLEDCTIVNNTCNSWGGGLIGVEATNAIALYGESLTLMDISNTQISFNVAGLGGGAIAVFSEAEIFLAECTITSNIAPSGGAIFLQYDNDVSIAECTITGNTALSNGGGIYCSDSTITMDKQSALSNNTSPDPEQANIFCAQDISYTICQIDGESEFTDFCDMVAGNGGSTAPVLSGTGLAIVIVVLGIGALSIIGVIAIGCYMRKKRKQETQYKFLEMQDDEANLLVD